MVGKIHILWHANKKQKRNELAKPESIRETWWHADKKQDKNALAKPLLSILQEVEGGPVVKSKVLHLFR